MQPKRALVKPEGSTCAGARSARESQGRTKVELVAGAPKRQCGGIARYTLRSWAVNQDDDVWLSMRGTRHLQKCVHCDLLNSAFPFGHQSPDV